MADALPEYDALQSAFHETFAADLDRILDGVGLRPGLRVLDAPCGNGFYARRIAARIAPGGHLVAADASPAYLGLAATALADAPPGVTAETRQVDVYALPFPDAAFDFVWCAQSLISLTDNVRALAELARVTRPGGQIAVLEADEFHHVLLPWPVDLELDIQRAVFQASRRSYGGGSRLAPARHLRQSLREAGWRPGRKLSFASDRQSPFRRWEAEFLRLHLGQLADLVRERLSPESRARFDALVDPDTDGSFFRQPDAELTCLNTLHLAGKSAT